ncbi:ABC transporter ATP-binding protein, partial [Luteimonas sp. 8-5]|nr:ABC transporter ATP-binding protein [Luteimonas sp. 8-5]
AAPAVEARTARDVQAPPAAPTQAPARRKLSYKDQRELEQLPARIEQLEARVAELTEAMHDPAFYQRDGAAIAAHGAELAAVQAELDSAYARWEALEES